MNQKPFLFFGFADSRSRPLTFLSAEENSIRKALKINSEGENEHYKAIFRAHLTKDSWREVFHDNALRNRMLGFHFGGHADGHQFILEGPDKTSAPASGDFLVDFFRQVKNDYQKDLHFVIINGCYSDETARLLNEFIPAVIGTETALYDEAAGEFSALFYEKLAVGETLNLAFHSAITGMKNSKAGSKNRQQFPPEKVWKIRLQDGAGDWKLNRPKITYNLAAINQQIMTSFNDEDLTLFCQLNFEEVHNNFSDGQSKQRKTMMLIEYCKRRNLLATLTQLL